MASTISFFHEPKISGAIYDVCIGNAVDKFIKKFGKVTSDGWLSFAADPSGGNAVIIFCF